MSGWLLMGLPGAMYLGGVSEAWIAIGLVLGAWANWRFVAGPLRVYTERTDNALTLPDYFTTRFAADGKVLRIASALVILVFFAIYAASGIVAGARLFESVFGLPYAQALWWGAAATILYTLVGGFLAVSWTDTVQATLMIFALILTPVIVIISTGGLGDSLRVIEQLDPAQARLVQGRRTGRGRHRFVAGLGAGLFRAAAYPGAFHGRRFAGGDPAGAAHRHDLDGAVPGWVRWQRVSSASPISRSTRTRPGRSPKTTSASSLHWPSCCSIPGSQACCCRRSWPRS